jgi:predicted MFS family arabinose efflux permease
MIVADVLRVLVVALLLLVRSRDWIWLIYLSAFLESVVSQFFNPAKSAIIPLLVTKDDLLPANSLNGLSDALTRLLGSALGGVLMGWLGFSSVVFLDAGSFLVSAILIFFILMPKSLSGQADPGRFPLRGNILGMGRDWVAGLRLVKREQLLLALFIMFGVASLGDSMITVLIVPLVKVLMGGGAQLLGWLMMAQGIGGLLGGLLVGQIARYLPPRLISISGVVLAGISILLLVNIPHSIFVLPLMAGIGMTAAAWSISSETLLQMGTSDRFRGRIFGALGTLTASASLVGMLLAGVLADQVGLVLILDISGGFFIVSGVLAWRMLPGTQKPDRPEQLEKDYSPSKMPVN